MDEDERDDEFDDDPGEVPQLGPDEQAELIRCYQAAFLTPEGVIVLNDLRRALDVYGADGVADEELVNTPHPYRAYEERGMMRALRRIEGMVQFAEQEREAEVDDS